MMINSQIGTEMAAWMIVNAVKGGAGRDNARQDREPETWQETVAFRHPVPVVYAGALGRNDLAAMAAALIGTAP